MRTTDRHPGHDPETEALEVFFKAARAAEAPPDAALLSRILGDAAEVSAAARPAPTPAPARPAPRWGGVAALLGGWRGGAALTACALIGLLIGATGYARLTTDGAGYYVAGDTASDIGEFYDLAALE